MRFFKSRIRSLRSFVKNHPLSVNYGIDGILFMGAGGIAGNNNLLFAQRLGANNFHLSMLQFLPQIILLFLLIPAGMMADSMKNKRLMMSAVLIMSGVFFAIAGVSTFLPVQVVYFFLIFVALANVSAAMYNMSWQAFFPEAVAEHDRNNVLTFRARMTMIVQLVLPLAVGTILASIQSDAGKIAAHQVFYIITAMLLLSNAIHIRKIKATHPSEPKRISFAEMKIASGRLAKNKPFIIFCLAILFFHMTWHFDWTLYFIAQRDYMGMNEVMLSLAPVGGMLGQLLTLKFWSKNNAKQGIEFPLVYGMLGLIFSPIAVILGVSLPQSYGPFVFLAFHALGHMAFANITLNLFQCLLKVVDDEYRSFSISVYTCLITLSNAVMPVVGVLVYEAWGGDLNALRYTNLLLLVLRVVAAGLWLLRLRWSRAVA